MYVRYTYVPNIDHERSLIRTQIDLQEAYASYDAGKIKLSELVRAQDRAAEDSIKRMEATGQELVTDGEQRASSFATYPITESVPFPLFVIFLP